NIEDEARSLAELAFRADFAIHQPEQLPAQIETQPSTLVDPLRRAVELTKCFEQHAYLLEPHPNAGIGDGHQQHDTSDASGDVDTAALRELHGIVDQVEQHLKAPLAVPHHRDARAREFGDDLEPFLIRSGLEALDHLLDHFGEVEMPVLEA